VEILNIALTVDGSTVANVSVNVSGISSDWLDANASWAVSAGAMLSAMVEPLSLT
jgi:hypothetical protein